MKSSTLVTACIVLMGILASDAQDANPPQIGIYFRPTRDLNMAILGYDGIFAALEDDEDLGASVRYVDDLKPETMKGLKVLILSCVYDFPRDWDRKALRDGIRAFVAGGGGIILVNESIGWRRVFSDSPLFPELGKGAGQGDKYMVSMQSGVGPATIKYVGIKPCHADHPVVRGVGAFEALFDMPEIVPGNHGLRLMEQKEGGAAAVVAGQFGQGRVVLIAPNIGIGERNMERPPEDDALTLLLNTVRWCAGE